MKKLKKLFVRLVSIVFIVAMACMGIAVFVRPMRADNVFGCYSVVTKVIIVLLALALVAFRIWFFSKTRKMHISKKVGIIIASVFAVFGTIVMYFVVPKPVSAFDSSSIYELVNWKANGLTVRGLTYFIIYPHNLGIVYFYLPFAKLASKLGFRNTHLTMAIVTIILVFTAIYLLVLSAKKIFKYKDRGALVALMMSVVFPVLLYASELYTDSIAGFFVSLELYLMLLIKEKTKRQWLLILILGLTTGLGAVVKVTSAIPVMAFVFVELVNLISSKAKITPKKALIVAAGFLATIAIVMGNNLVTDKLVPDAKNGKLPYTHWVMMGMQGDGRYSDDDFNASVAHRPNAQEYNMEIMKERLHDLGVIGYIKLLARKLSVTWGDGMYNVFAVIGNMPRKETSVLVQTISYTGKYFPIYRFIMSVFQIAWITSVLVMAFMTRKVSTDKLVILKTSLLGIFLFLLIWETNSRYLVNFLPVIIIIQEYATYIIWKNVKEKLKNGKE